jgi:hypothetical protein
LEVTVWYLAEVSKATDTVGVGLASANGAGLALLPLAVILWRIHVEENGVGEQERAGAEGAFGVRRK